MMYVSTNLFLELSLNEYHHRCVHLIRVGIVVVACGVKMFIGDTMHYILEALRCNTKWDSTKPPGGTPEVGSEGYHPVT